MFGAMVDTNKKYSLVWVAKYDSGTRSGRFSLRKFVHHGRGMRGKRHDQGMLQSNGMPIWAASVQKRQDGLVCQYT